MGRGAGGGLGCMVRCVWGQRCACQYGCCSLFMHGKLSVLGMLMAFFIGYSPVLWVLVCSGGCDFVWVDSGQYMATTKRKATTHRNTLKPRAQVST